MRISDWSSDVCSSDLLSGTANKREIKIDFVADRHSIGDRRRCLERHRHRRPFCFRNCAMIEGDQSGGLVNRGYLTMPLSFYRRGCRRSEEHTSELQSLMRISYAVFCLKKKKYTNQQFNAVYT